MKLAVIPARGGSKRIPGKNIRNFCGRPIIAYSIAAACDSGLFDRIVVSTDDERVAKVACEYGAEVPFLRPATLADDHTGTNAVVRHAVEWFDEQGQAVLLACCIYATAPFLSPADLREGYVRLMASDGQYAFSVTSFAFPVQRAIRLFGFGGVEPVWPEHALTRSQDLEELFHDAGQFYWGRARAFLDDLPVYAVHSIPIVLPRYRVQDIDTEEDWQRAELMYRVLNVHSCEK